ncbi:hypothetical protein ACRAWF_29965 [Streptomyces sp. L7]
MTRYPGAVGRAGRRVRRPVPGLPFEAVHDRQGQGLDLRRRSARRRLRRC